MLTLAELEQELVIAVGMARRLSPPLNDRPGLFLEQKDALAHFLELLRDRAAGRAPPERSFTAATTDTGITAIRRGGRVIQVERRGR